MYVFCTFERSFERYMLFPFHKMESKKKLKSGECEETNKIQSMHVITIQNTKRVVRKVFTRCRYSHAFFRATKSRLAGSYTTVNGRENENHRRRIRFTKRWESHRATLRLRGYARKGKRENDCLNASTFCTTYCHGLYW